MSYAVVVRAVYCVPSTWLFAKVKVPGIIGQSEMRIFGKASVTRARGICVLFNTPHPPTSPRSPRERRVRGSPSPTAPARSHDHVTERRRSKRCTSSVTFVPLSKNHPFLVRLSGRLRQQVKEEARWLRSRSRRMSTGRRSSRGSQCALPYLRITRPHPSRSLSQAPSSHVMPFSLEVLGGRNFFFAPANPCCQMSAIAKASPPPSPSLSRGVVTLRWMGGSGGASVCDGEGRGDAGSTRTPRSHGPARTHCIYPRLLTTTPFLPSPSTKKPKKPKT